MLRLARTVNSDLESVSGWTQLPNDGRPFQCELVVKSKRDSQIDQILQQLGKNRSRRNREVFPSADSAVVSGRIAFTIPSSLKVLAQNWLDIQKTELTMQGLMESVIDSGAVDTVFTAGPRNKTRPLVSGTIAASGNTKNTPRLGQLGPFPDTAIVGKDAVQLTVPQLFSQEFRPTLSARLRLNKGQFDWSLDDVGASGTDLETEMKPRELRSGVICAVSVKLDGLASQPADSNDRKFVMRLERMYDWYVRDLMEGISAVGLNVGEFDRNGFQSFCDRVQDGETWRAEATVRVVDASLVLSMKIGADLYAFLEARRLAAPMRYRTK